MQNWQKQVLKMTEQEPYNLIKNLDQMKTTERDFTVIDGKMKSWGFSPYEEMNGCYFHAQLGFSFIDLTATAETDEALISEILKQTMNIGTGIGMETVQQNIRVALGL
jgi:hypothetical protein